MSGPNSRSRRSSYKYFTLLWVRWKHAMLALKLTCYNTKKWLAPSKFRGLGSDDWLVCLSPTNFRRRTPSSGSSGVVIVYLRHTASLEDRRTDIHGVQRQPGKRGSLPTLLLIAVGSSNHGSDVEQLLRVDFLHGIHWHLHTALRGHAKAALRGHAKTAVRRGMTQTAVAGRMTQTVVGKGWSLLVAGNGGRGSLEAFHHGENW